MKQLHQPEIGIELHQWRYRRVAEFRNSLINDSIQRRRGNGRADKRCHDSLGQGAIGQAAPVGNLAGTEARPGFRQVETAVTGETGQQYLGEIQNRSLAPGAHIAQIGPPGRAAPAAHSPSLSAIRRGGPSTGTCAGRRLPSLRQHLPGGGE